MSYMELHKLNVFKSGDGEPGGRIANKHLVPDSLTLLARLSSRFEPVPEGGLPAS